jgi:hypothetical protein
MQITEPIDYLIIGHITQDKTAEGMKIGGTAAYAAKTAMSLGLRVGIYTSWGEEVGLEVLDGIQIYNPIPMPSTTFENQNTSAGRKSIISQIAGKLEYYEIPQVWRDTPLIHFAPVAQEFNPISIKYFKKSKVLVTPQGWLRKWDEAGNVSFTDWPEYKSVLGQAFTIVISEEDINFDYDRIPALASATQILIVTKGKNGALLFENGKELQINTPQVEEVDATGAGDIFATAFFIQYINNVNSVESAEFAANYAARSVQYSGEAAFPSRENLYQQYE